MYALFWDIQIHRAVLRFILATLFRIRVILHGGKTAFMASVGSQHTLLKDLPVPVPMSLSSCGIIHEPVSATQEEGSGCGTFHRVRTCGEWLESYLVGSRHTVLKEKALGPQSAASPLQNPRLL